MQRNLLNLLKVTTKTNKSLPLIVISKQIQFKNVVFNTKLKHCISPNLVKHLYFYHKKSVK